MTVTKIEPVTKTRFRVYVDERFAFVLYKGELSRYHIAVDGELDEEDYDEIFRDIIVKRVKARALHLLSDMGRTEAQLRSKLELGGYTVEAVVDAVGFVM